MFKRYGLIGSLRGLISLIYTRLFFKNSRLIRFPIDVRNKKSISWGVGLTTGVGNRIECYPKNKKQKTMFFGNNIQINDYVHITASEMVIIEDNVLIASKVYISDCSHGSYGRNNIHDSPKSIPKDREIH